jgi:hypothetical protein
MKAAKSPRRYHLVFWTANHVAPPTVDDIRTMACAAVFSGRLVSNMYRGLVAEIIVGAALASEWQMCSGDWRGWDFQHGWARAWK